MRPQATVTSGYEKTEIKEKGRRRPFFYLDVETLLRGGSGKVENKKREPLIDSNK